MLSPEQSWDGIYLTSPEEATDGGIPALEDNVEIAVERAIQASRGVDRAISLVFGLDPGPRPGLAWLADGVIVGSAQLESIDSVADHILGLATAVDHENLIVKVGDGAPLIRDRIINQLILSGIQCILVNEKNTSRGSRTKAHIHAATRIAIMGGEKIFQLRKLEPTNGDLKEIQRQSRILSLGELTISTELARMVACGDLSLEDAIKRA